MFRDIMSTEISVSEHAPPSCDPVTVLSYVRDLQSKVVLMSKDKSALSLKAATLQRALDVAEKRVNDLVGLFCLSSKPCREFHWLGGGASAIRAARHRGKANRC